MSEAFTQSAMHAAPGSGAELLHELGLVLYIGAGLIFTAVMCLVIYAVFTPERRADMRRWVIGGGVIFPVVTLSALLVYSLSIGNSLELHAPDDALRIQVTGKQWWWEVRYEAEDFEGAIVLANELHIPADRRVRIELTTSDVIHSFWAPSLAGKVDMIPGRTNHLVLEVDEPGVYRGQCAEYCGGQHAWMAFHVIVEPEENFRAWLAGQVQPASTPDDPFLKLGYDMFFRGECHECHAIRGTPANATDGPDLTHVGSRHSLAAGMLRNHIGTMAGWIAGAQDMKPGAAMPSMNVYTGRELRALSAWLESLE
ncbi:MAG: cytochrome c oxidase subunit II [Steroidobacter sp.]